MYVLVIQFFFLALFITCLLQIIPNIYACHFDPEIWETPESFNPLRHIDNDGNFIRSHKIIPCSIGPRFCLGRDIVHVEEFIIFVNLLQKFQISPVLLPFPSVKEGKRNYSPFKVVLTTIK